MARRFLIIVLCVGLTACASLRARLAFWRHPAPPATASAALGAPLRQTPRVPHLADGLWAILDPGCRKPALADLRAWPKCASPFWINRDSAVVVRSKPGRRGHAPDTSYRTDYRLAAGDPLIAQVGNARDGFVFLALTELARDDQGRLVSATGAAFGCATPTQGAISLRPNQNGCESQTPEALRKVAWESLQNPAALTRVAWIAPGAP